MFLVLGGEGRPGSEFSVKKGKGRAFWEVKSVGNGSREDESVDGGCKGDGVGGGSRVMGVGRTRA